MSHRTVSAPSRKILITSPGVFAAEVWQDSGGGINRFYDLAAAGADDVLAAVQAAWYTIRSVMKRARATGLALFGWLFRSLLRTLRAVNWPAPAA